MFELYQAQAEEAGLLSWQQKEDIDNNHARLQNRRRDRWSSNKKRICGYAEQDDIIYKRDKTTLLMIGTPLLFSPANNGRQ
jgi:hypothetical protein